MGFDNLSRRVDENVAVAPPLSQAVGYVVVVVIGLVIAFSEFVKKDVVYSWLILKAMIFITKILKRTVGEDNEKTEMLIFHTLRFRPLLMEIGS